MIPWSQNTYISLLFLLDTESDEMGIEVPPEKVLNGKNDQSKKVTKNSTTHLPLTYSSNINRG